MGTAKYVFVRDDYLFNRMTLAIDNVNMKKRCDKKRKLEEQKPLVIKKKQVISETKVLIRKSRPIVGRVIDIPILSDDEEEEDEKRVLSIGETQMNQILKRVSDHTVYGRTQSQEDEELLTVTLLPKRGNSCLFLEEDEM